ncbi:MAG TPA: DUF3419 family protein [Burkholderiales bacterium]|nr:DUF3419 family protein [Burkholderiales bacterium]
MKSEVEARAEFTAVRYAQCWEDADVLVDALDVKPGDVCVSIASAGDNTLALLARAPSRVIALDLSAAQLACLELRVAAYRVLEHAELLELIGSRPSARRSALYERCRTLLSPQARAFWDANAEAVRRGVGSAGRFERYFQVFRERVLPLVHGRASVQALLEPRSADARRRFYAERWNTWRWRLLFRLFFSRFVMGRLGRDKAFFDYVEGSVADRILERTRYALTELSPADNPYLSWILTGTHGAALPFALRAENFDAIRSHLDRLEWRQGSLEASLDELGSRAVDRYNLSDIFEYMSPEGTRALLERLAQSGRSGGRLAYWNMLAPRSRPEALADRLKPLTDLAQRLFARDKAFFYSALVIEEVA